MHNPYGGFRIEFANNYIRDYLLIPRGESGILKTRLSWWEISRLTQDWLFKLERLEDKFYKVQAQAARFSKYKDHS